MNDHDPAAVAAGRLRRRLRTVAAAYLVAAAVFGVLGVFGGQAVANDLDAVGVPWIVAAAGAFAGALLISVAAWRAGVAVVGAGAGDAPLSRAVAVARRGRRLILLAAAAAVVAAAVLAPLGDDELAFVVGLNAAVAVMLVVFAAVADDVGRAIRRFPVVSGPPAQG